jgi:hypothetical protein
MMLRLALFVLAILCGSPACARVELDVSLAHGSEAEQRTKLQLQALLTKHDLSRWIYTRRIAIEARAIPHSHPTLTLNTRHLDRSDLLLSTFVHEQMHWFLAQRERDASAAMDELRAMFPKIPVGFPEGSSDEEGNYEHLIVIYLEYQADQALLGEPGARAVMDFWSHDHYTWLYRTVLDDGPRIAAVVRKHGLLP